MAGAITYNTGYTTLNYVYRTTTGGTVFSANLVAETVFDYFADDAVVNDALYIGATSTQAFSDITFNIGTALAGTGITVVWEYYDASTLWVAVPSQSDDTVGFTALGSKAFKFGLPFNWNKKVVNSSTSAFWIRARISALTTITEGGANSTAVVTIKDSKVNIDGYTDGSPCTLDLVWTYLNANYSYLSNTCTKTNNHYNFTPVSLYINSRLKVVSQSFEFGLGNNPGVASLAYLQMGVKIDNYFGYNGGTLWIRGAPNTGPFTVSATTLLYGSTIIGIGGPGYPGWSAETIDCNIDGINWSPSSSGIIRNCRILNPGTWICSGAFFGTFERNRVTLTSSCFGLFYGSNVTINGIDYGILTPGAAFFLLYQTRANPTFTVINPNPLLPGITTTSKVVSRNITAPTTSFGKVWYYDTSADTYTDYTTEFSDATEDNAPISGDVGDIYYFGEVASGTCDLNPVWLINTSLVSNDFVYSYEFYYSGAWRTFSPVRDRTENFTVDNELMYFGKDGFDNSPSALTINGFAGYWMRMTITTKGTGSPAITRLRRSNQNGCGSWNIYEKFTLDLKVVDKSNVVISGAEVKIDLSGVNVYTGNTDVDGLMTQQTLTSRRWYFDPINYYSNYQQVAEIVNPDYDITITKAGFETVRMKLTMNEIYDLIVSMKVPMGHASYD